MGYVVTNIAYGTGPYIRITELCIAFNNELERRGKERLPFIVPWVYGSRQKEVMLKEFASHEKAYPNEILLDATLGKLLGSFFYANSTYEEALNQWVETESQVTDAIRKHFSGAFVVEALSGKQISVGGKDIVLEINRSPRILYGIAPAYSTSFGYVSDILEGAMGKDRRAIDANPELLAKGAALASSVEARQALSAMAYPGTFSWENSYTDRFGATLVPPITDLPKIHTEPMEEGLYATITGIPGLERLYREAKDLGLKLYSNDTDAVLGSEKALPHVISNPAIKLQFARSGWGSVWHSMLCGTPIVVPEFDPKDDPEIYFNNRAVEALGIGTVYRGQPLSEILSQSESVRAAQKTMREEIANRWGTVNGNEVCARHFADHYTRNTS